MTSLKITFVVLVLSLSLCAVCAEQKAALRQNTINEKKLKHPCEDKHCEAGTECIVQPDHSARCECVRECRAEFDDRKKVCSNFNVTFDSVCHLHQMACWCREGANACDNKEYEHLHVDYFGSCRQISICSGDEMSDFPRRMRDWLFNIMKDLAQKKALDSDYDHTDKDIERNHGQRWVDAVIWKFCDFTKEPANRFVSRHELYPLKAPLLVMEHCIAPFLDSCDADNDHKVTLDEWGTCLGFDLEQIQDKCHSMLHGKEL